MSRPDPNQQGHPQKPLTPDRIRDHRFTTRRRGLDPDEIAAFLARVADELAVARTALTDARALTQVTGCVDAGEVTVSQEDAQGVRHRVFCDRLLPGGGRCALPTEHSVPCTARRRRPNPDRFR
ncbi:DivIVA domain-containing protein [Micromonospora inyonensis]|uniref:DivIVA domain-containing protein n=1 Tax=Micromonospora inyonensis TaxID=47866 RepID=A0A1C6RIP1_9ACTN|nr:DivIVA domain-containing protein [Micromonospora inyonensis]